MRTTNKLLLSAGAAFAALVLLTGALTRSASSSPRDKPIELTIARASEAAPTKARSPKRAAPMLVPVREVTSGESVLAVGWGGGPRELGRELPREGGAVGPMSVAVDWKGRALVVDGVNGRLVRYGKDGKPDLAIPISPTSQDVATAPNGALAVLDRFGERAVTLFDEQGAPLGRLPLAGDGVTGAGLVTGVFVDGDDIYVERSHDGLVRLGTISGGVAEPRVRVPGRPSRDGKSFLRAGIANRQTGSAWVSAIARDTSEERFMREVKHDGTLRTIEALDSDKRGTIYLAASVVDAQQRITVALSCFDGETGASRGGATLPANTLPDETFRDLAVLDEGGVLYAERTEAGVSYRRFDCEL